MDTSTDLFLKWLKKTHMFTKHDIIEIYSVVFQFNMTSTTGTKVIEIDIFIKKKIFDSYNSDDNVCIFTCISVTLNSVNAELLKHCIQNIAF